MSWKPQEAFENYIFLFSSVRLLHFAHNLSSSLAEVRLRKSFENVKGLIASLKLNLFVASFARAIKYLANLKGQMIIPILFNEVLI